MPKSFLKLQKRLTFDNLIRHLQQQFNRISDHRRANKSYSLPDGLKSAFAMVSLKSPSLLSFQEQTRIERRTLKQIYRLGEIPVDSQRRAIFDKVEPCAIRSMFPSIVTLLRQARVVKQYQYWHKHLLVSIDGVEHFNSRKIHCPNCATKGRRDGTISYQHAALAAVVVHPEQKEVLPIDFEPILCQDGAEKNDGEPVAAKRLLESLSEKYPHLKMLLVEDALYANAPHIRQVVERGWNYILNVKPDSHNSLCKQFEWREESALARHRWREIEPRGVKQHFSWTENLFLCSSAADVKVNFLWFEETDKKTGKVTRWRWASSLPLTAKTVEKVMKTGRARWKIENETFNTLKNQGYNFEHNYGHGQRWLATVLAMLTMVAFLVDQIQERCCEWFKQLRTNLRTRAKLWDSMRSLFKIVAFPSMSSLYAQMAELYEIQLQ